MPFCIFVPMKQISNLFRCVKRLRGYESQRLRKAVYYSSFVGGREMIARVKHALTTGSKKEVQYQLIQMKGYLYTCFCNGYLQDGYEFDVLRYMVNVYIRIVDNAWWAVKIYDILKF